MTSLVPTFIPLRDLRGIGGWPADRSALRRHVKKAGYETVWMQGVGGRQIAVRAHAIPERVLVSFLKNAVGLENTAVANDTLLGEFLKKPPKAQVEAKRRLQILIALDQRIANGETAQAAIAQVSAEMSVDRGTLHRWRSIVRGLPRADWLPALAPKWKPGGAVPAACDDTAWEYFKADYLRVQQPSVRACYRRLARVAKKQGWTIPSRDTLRRRLEKELSRPALRLAREGRDALDRTYPHQTRDCSVFHALEAINMDGRRIDLFVRWPDGEITRIVMVAVQDLYSRKILAWRVDRTENSDLVRLALMDCFERYGIPKAVWFDNGRAFANKFLTGRTPHRFRFKITAGDPLGMLPLLGIDCHFTLPRRGQSKPAERAWGDFAESIDRHPAFAGAYTGNAPDAKPEDYGSRAIDLADFVRVAEAEIAEHNTRVGRQTRVCAGKLSFDQAFEDSYRQTAPRKLTAEQRAYFLMRAEGVKADRNTGAVTLRGNRYYSDALNAHAGKRLVVRFDPLNLHAPVAVETMDGRMIAARVPCWEPVGFNDTGSARDHARNKARHKRAAREQLDAARKMTAAQAGARYLEATAPDAPAPVPETKIVTGVFGAKPPKAAPQPRPHREQPGAIARGLERMFGAERFQQVKAR